MQITLNQVEILEAIEAHVRRQIAVPKHQVVNIDLRAGRSENGFTATLDINIPVSAAQPVLSQQPFHPTGYRSAEAEIPPTKPTILEVTPDTPEADIAVEQAVSPAADSAPVPRAIGAAVFELPKTQKAEEPAREPEAEPAPRTAGSLFGASVRKMDPPAVTKAVEEAPAAEPEKEDGEDQDEDEAVIETPAPAPAAAPKSIFNFAK